MCHQDGCDREQFCKGLCRSHYYRLRRYGDPGQGRSYKDQRPECSEYGCPNPARTKGPKTGYCIEHGFLCDVCGKPAPQVRCGLCRSILAVTDSGEALSIVAEYVRRNRGV